jgi:hypothetical protein
MWRLSVGRDVPTLCGKKIDNATLGIERNEKRLLESTIGRGVTRSVTKSKVPADVVGSERRKIP